MKIISYWLFIVGAIVFASYQATGVITVVYNPGAMLLVFGPMAALLLATNNLTGLIGLARRMLRNEIREEDGDLLAKLNVTGFLFAGIAVILGGIHVLRNLGTPDHIGPGVGLALIALVYSAVAPLCSLPFLGKIPLKRANSGAILFLFCMVPGSLGALAITLKYANVI